MGPKFGQAKQGLASLCSVMSGASAGKTPLAGGGEPLQVSSLMSVVPGWSDSKAGFIRGSHWEHPGGLSAC